MENGAERLTEEITAEKSEKFEKNGFNALKIVEKIDKEGISWHNTRVSEKTRLPLGGLK